MKIEDYKLPTDKVEVSDYKKVTIKVETSYKNGRGWENYQDAFRFENEIMDILGTEGGYRLVLPKKQGECFMIEGKSSFDKTSLYLHPREFSGYLKHEDLDKICALLRDFKEIKNFKVTLEEDVYDLSDIEYGRLITDNFKDILKCYDGSHPSSFAEDFVSNCRIPRAGDDPGYSNRDVDWMVIESGVKILQNVGYFEMKERQDSLDRSDEEDYDEEDYVHYGYLGD